VVAPATANIIGKLASGIADDLLSTLLLAVPKETVQGGRVLFAPAMNTNMWQNPAVMTNVRQLAAAGYRFIAPGEGELACGTSGPGRMAEPPVIFEQCRAALNGRPSPIGNAPPFANTRVVVTAGRTEEPLDPVRVITNRSSGRMGVEIARAFADAGAQVRLIAGELSVPLPTGVTVSQATTTERMLRAVLAALPRTDVLVMCAAVADYRPARAAEGKHHEATITVRLERTPDILKEVSRRHHHAVVVGFSLDDSVARAKAKLERKQLDLIVANPFVTAGSGTIKARLVARAGQPRGLKPMSKPDFARLLVAEVAALLARRTNK
jgi:phosphopantothenoylcysteine decarboxylase/phosphopantothenate--cysteine ligase